MKIKGFDKDLKCRNYQFEIGKEFKIELKEGQELELCTDTVFHYCDSLQKVHSYYSCNDETNRYCEIEVLGEEVSDEEKCGSNHIRIVREIVGDELNLLKGLINGNTGLFNTGDMNTGDMNTGDMNTGYWNTGDMNTGDMNTGNMNTGDMNTGNRNTGNMNTGDMNTGNRNTGDMNTGNRNTGNFNSCNWSNGFFNTKEPTVNIFNVDSGMTATEFRNSKYYGALYSAPFYLTEWVEYSEEEKKNDVKKECIGGYLKKYTFQEACANWWSEMSDNNKEIIKSIPNFNAEIFKEITGIEV